MKNRAQARSRHRSMGQVLEDRTAFGWAASGRVACPRENFHPFAFLSLNRLPCRTPFVDPRSTRMTRGSRLRPELLLELLLRYRSREVRLQQCQRGPFQVRARGGGKI